MLPKSFRFSAKITGISFVLAVLMVTASFWQWDRYLWKKDLIATYNAQSAVAPVDLPLEGDAAQYAPLLYHKVVVRGVFDLAHQVIVINRRHQMDTGYWLLAPFKISGTDSAIMVSRGFIPFEEREPEQWKKYDVSGEVSIVGVLQESVDGGILNPTNTVDLGVREQFPRKWRYPDVPGIAKLLDYPVIPHIFVQQLGGETVDGFPAEAISIRVPPSTHFWYSIEWALLALASVLIGFLMQAFPRKRKPEAKLF